MQSTSNKLSNLQLELLKIYSRDIKDNELLEIKEILARYFANKAMDEADRIWNERGYSNELMDKILHGDHQ